MRTQLYANDGYAMNFIYGLIQDHLDDDYEKDITIIVSKDELSDILLHVDQDRYKVIDIEYTGDFMMVSSLKSGSDSSLYVECVHDRNGETTYDESDILVVSPSIPDNIRNYYVKECEYKHIFDFIPYDRMKDAYLEIVTSDDI